MYLDPGFGSMLIQMIIAAFAACGAVFFMMKSKLKTKFGKKKGTDTQQAEAIDGAAESNELIHTADKDAAEGTEKQ